MHNLYLDLKKSIAYNIDADTLEIYTQTGNFRKANITVSQWGFIIAAIIVPIIAWFIEPIRPIFNLYFLTRETNVVIIIVTIVIHMLFGFFFREIVRSVEKRVSKLSDEDYNKKIMKEMQPVNQTEAERKALIRKSFNEMPLLIGFGIICAIVLLYPLMNVFIYDSNLLTYILFSMLSLFLTASTAFLMRFYFGFLLRLAIKERVFSRQERAVSRNSRKEEKERNKTEKKKNRMKTRTIVILWLLMSIFVFLYFTFSDDNLNAWELIFISILFGALAPFVVWIRDM